MKSIKISAILDIENEESEIKSFLGFIEKAEEFETICIRPEVRENVERAFEHSMLKELERTQKPDYSLIQAELFPYQKEGVEFVLFKKVAIIADEMGLGKTIQAAAAAVLKKQIFGFSKTLVVCPATLKSQWKKEIERFTNEKALVVNGTPKERAAQYLDDSYFFFIVNYETILRDSLAINKAGIDFLILDEAQRVKNYETKTSSSIKRLLLASMRMVCDSTYLIDEKTNISPKMEELKSILFEKLDLGNSSRKIIIFSEWVKVHKLIGQMLRQNKIGFVELNGKVPVKSRGDLIKKFENSPECQVFLSTEAGGAGLNLQIADTLINFELPWNPAKKNQRIGRIDRLGQKSSKLTIYNLISRNSIEQQIAAGLLVKQNLFEGVLDSSSTTDYVDFSSKGRSQFIDQLEAFVNRVEEEDMDTDDIAQETFEEVIEQEEELSEDISLTDSRDDAADGDIEQKSGEGADKDTDTDTDTDTGKGIAKDTDKPEADAVATSEERKSAPGSGESKTAEFEQVMTSGMQFLAGLYKMSTGKDLGLDGQQIKINKETGEVTMTFKLPV